MTQKQSLYEFQPGLPVPGVAAGTNLLVSGPSGSGARQIGLELCSWATSKEGVLLLSADVEGRVLLDRLDEIPRPVTRSMLGIVDCSGVATHDEERFVAHTAPISDPGDLAAIELECSLLYEKLAARDPRGVRIGVFSVTSLLAHSSFKEVSRFLHLLTGRIIATEDLGVFVLDTTIQDERVVETMRHFCDGHVQVRRADDGGVELQVRGLDDRPEMWEPVDFDVQPSEWPTASTADGAPAPDTESRSPDE